jgi:hypothetical protein
MTKLNPNVTSPSGIAATLTPFLSALRSSCERAEVVGPVRRGELSTEADFIAVPRQLTVDLFGSPEADTAAIEECLRKWGTMSRRNDGAFVVLLRHPIDGAPSVERVNVALVPEDVEWGLAVLRGTGPADYVRDLLSKLEESGIRLSPDKYFLHDAKGVRIRTPDEASVFAVAKVTPIAPHERGKASSPHIARTPISGGTYKGDHQGRGMTIERD